MCGGEITNPAAEKKVLIFVIGNVFKFDPVVKLENN